MDHSTPFTVFNALLQRTKPIVDDCPHWEHAHTRRTTPPWPAASCPTLQQSKASGFVVSSCLLLLFPLASIRRPLLELTAVYYPFRLFSSSSSSSTASLSDSLSFGTSRRPFFIFVCNGQRAVTVIDQTHGHIRSDLIPRPPAHLSCIPFIDLLRPSHLLSRSLTFWNTFHSVSWLSTTPFDPKSRLVWALWSPSVSTTLTSTLVTLYRPVVSLQHLLFIHSFPLFVDELASDQTFTVSLLLLLYSSQASIRSFSSTTSP